MTRFFLRLYKHQGGATAIEYGLIAALVSVAAIGALTTMGTSLEDMFTTVSEELQCAIDDTQCPTEAAPEPAPAS